MKCLEAIAFIPYESKFTTLNFYEIIPRECPNKTVCYIRIEF